MDNYEIRQNGKPFLSGDETSMKMVFNNMTGKNLKGYDYVLYKRFIKSQGANLEANVELYEDGRCIQTGKIL